MKLRISSVVSG